MMVRTKPAFVIPLLALVATGSTFALAACKKPAIKNDDAKDAANAPLSVPSSLPVVTHGSVLKPAKYTAIVTTADISIDGTSIALMPPPERWSLGIDAQYKKNGPSDLQILPITYALARERDDASVHDADARVVIDGTVPYRIVTEILFTLGQNGIATFRLVARGEKDPRELDITAPHTTKDAAGRITLSMIAATDGGSLPDYAYEPTAKEAAAAAATPPKPVKMAGFGLSVILLSDGILIKNGGGNLTPGCKENGPGLTIGKDAKGYKQDELATCLKTLRKDHSELAEELTTITAAPEVTYREVLQTIDTTQGAGFIHTVLGAARQ